MKRNEKLEFPTIEFTQVTFLGTGNSGPSCQLDLTPKEAEEYKDEIETTEVNIILS